MTSSAIQLVFERHEPTCPPQFADKGDMLDAGMGAESVRATYDGRSCNMTLQRVLAVIKSAENDTGDFVDRAVIGVEQYADLYALAADSAQSPQLTDHDDVEELVGVKLTVVPGSFVKPVPKSAREQLIDHVFDEHGGDA